MSSSSSSAALGEDSLCRARLAEERRALQRGGLPVGFSARPRKAADGSVDLRTWSCGIAPRAGSAYRLPTPGATLNVELTFPASYPLSPPTAAFKPPIFHTNVFPGTGSVCVSMLLSEGHHGGRVSQHYQPSISLRDILVGLQVLLEEPNPASTLEKPCPTRRHRHSTNPGPNPS